MSEWGVAGIALISWCIGMAMGTIIEHWNAKHADHYGPQRDVAEDVLEELGAYIRNHAMLKAGRGNTDDVQGFIDWYRTSD